jgi:hypothetical protein
MQSQRRMIIEDQDGEDETDNDFQNEVFMQMKKLSLEINNDKSDMPFEKSRRTEHSSGECQKNTKNA